MSSLFKKAAQAVRSGPLVVPIFMAFAALLVIGCGLSWTDMETSYYGYLLLPIRRPNEWVAYLVAIMPSLGMICFGYVFMEDSRKNWAKWVTLSLLVADMGTDIIFKVAGQESPYTWPVAALDSFVVFVLLSELAVTISFGMLIELAPDFLEQVSRMWSMLNRSGMPGKVGGAMLYNEDENDSDDDSPGFPSHRFVNGGDPRRQQQSRPNLPVDRPRP